MQKQPAFETLWLKPSQHAGCLSFLRTFCKGLGWSQRLTAFFFGLPPSLPLALEAALFAALLDLPPI